MSGDERPPHPFYNWMSVIGATLAVFGGTAVAFFLFVGLLRHDGSGYGGLTLIPLVLLALLGAGLVAAGWLRESRRIARGEHSSFLQQVTFDPWRLATGFGPWLVAASVAGVSFLLLSAGAGSLATVEYSESNEFCTEACHSIMGPEQAAWQRSAHANVACVECHVGPGAEGFLEAKLGGVRQLVATLSGTVERPIHTPIENDVLSREMCEGCHRLTHTDAYETLARSYYLSGEDPSPVSLAMVLKVGDNGSDVVRHRGIHYHMQVAKRVEYKARDAKRQEVAWIRVTDADGKQREFELEDRELSEEEHAAISAREMGCLDCHNRVAHPFPTPIDLVNESLDAGVLPRDLPYVKQASVTALDGDYESTAAALKGIGPALEEFYDDEDPDVLEDHADQVASTAETLERLYQETQFPEMKADWRTHPENASHRYSAGCFRCHNDEMLDAEGEAVFSGCTTCHSILARDDEGIRDMSDFERGNDFVHPEDFSTLDDYSACWDCHTGGKALYE